MKYGIIWDLDGTLWDSSASVYKAWNAYTEEHGIDRRFTQTECRGFCGKTLEEIAAIAFPEAETEWRNRVIIECCDWECIPLAEHGGDLFPDVFPVLGLLRKKFHMSVVSNCGLGYIEAFFTGNHTGALFDDYENAARTGKSKAENIRLVMERNCIDRAVYIGDTLGDGKAAESAGIPFIHARYGFGEVPEAKYHIDRLTELPETLKRIFSE